MSGWAVFLDRDGVIIENRDDYVKSWGEVEFIPNALAAIRRLTEFDIPVIIVTNQSAVGRGIITAEFVHQVHERIVDEIRAHGGDIAGVYFCPHIPNAGCACRKPEPGMILQAAAEHDIDLGRSYIVGDALSDLASGQAAGGVRGVLVRTGRGRDQELAMSENDSSTVVEDLWAAVDFILGSSPYVSAMDH